MNISKDYELFLEAIAGLMVIDKDKKVVYMNEQCADYIKVDKEKAIGQDVKKVFPPSNMPNMLKGQNKYNTNITRTLCGLWRFASTYLFKPHERKEK